MICKGISKAWTEAQQKPLPDPLRRERGVKNSLSPALSEGRGRTISEIPRYVWEEGVRKKQASPQPSPKGEGEQLARFPDVFESA